MGTVDARFDHVGLNVENLEAATEWYQQALHLVVEGQFSIPDTEIRGVMLLHEPTGYRLELLNVPNSQPGMQPSHPNEAIKTRGYGHFCICVEDVPATFQELLDAGATVRMEPRPSPRPGATVSFLADPEGNLIEVINRPN